MSARLSLLALGIAIVGLSLAAPARAVTLSTSLYGEGDDIIITATVVPGDVNVIFFNTATGYLVNVTSFSGESLPMSVRDAVGDENFARFVVGDYSAVEAVYDETPPNCEEVTYLECLGLSDFEGEFTFRIVKPGGGGRRAHTPRIEVFSPRAGARLSGNIPITYEATDEDEALGQFDYGLKRRPVGFLYRFPTSFDWNVIAAEQPATGTVMWDTRKLPDGENYELQATAAGADGDFGGGIIGGLSVDNTPPSFFAKAVPSFSRGEPVRLEVESSEVLKKLPVATVTQFNHEPRRVELKGSVPGKAFSGTYEVESGFDGPARIAIEGEDLAGNRGSLMAGADTFAVGIQPPSAPVVEVPKDEERFSQPYLPLLGGFGLNAERVVVTQNGVKRYEQRDLKGGRFRFENLPLDPDFNKGRNVFRIVSMDPTGAASEPAFLYVGANRAPDVVLTEPRGWFSKLNGLVRFRWEGFDFNGDPLTYRVDLSDDRGRTWGTIAQALSGTEFAWDSSQVADGDYYLVRVVASDGAATTAAVSNRLSVANNLPAIVLDASGDVFVAESSQVVRGAVRSKDKYLATLEVSFDDGKTWRTVQPEDGAWDSAFERFAFDASAAPGRVQKVILRGITRSGEVVINAQRLRLVFDNVAPRLSLTAPSSAALRTSAVTVSGAVSDDVAGVKAVEYSVDGSEWYQHFLSGGTGGGEAFFAFTHPVVLPDDTYTFRVRAVDRAGNASAERSATVVIDTTPPRIGSFVAEASGTILFPGREGVFAVEPGTDVRLTLAVAGEPRRVKLFVNNGEVPIALSAARNLWESNFVVRGGEPTAVFLWAEDKIGNSSRRELMRITPPSPEAVATGTAGAGGRENLITRFWHAFSSLWRKSP